MAHFAQIDNNNVVTQVIVVSNDDAKTESDGLAFIKSLGLDGKWLQTSYNTIGNIHYGSDGKPDGGIAIRKNYAGPGYTYDEVNDAFIPPKPDSNFPYVIDKETFLWKLAIEKPNDGKNYIWAPVQEKWVEIDGASELVSDQPPADGKNYAYDSINNKWIEITEPTTPMPNDGSSYLWDIRENSWVQITTEIQAQIDKYK